jgi:hypothetical protein
LFRFFEVFHTFLEVLVGGVLGVGFLGVGGLDEGFVADVEDAEVVGGSGDVHGSGLGVVLDGFF